MRPKTDTSWLDVGVGENGSYVIRDYGRLDEVVSELTQPRQQYPFLSVFLGGKNKDIALQAIFPQNNIRRTQPSSRIGLRYDITSSNSESPILFADGNVTPTKGVLGAMPGVHDYPITWPISSTDNASRLVYARLIFLFADLVCLFADDFPDLMSVAHFLVDCVSMRSASPMPVAVRPRVLVVLMGNPDRSERNGPLQQFYKQLYEADSTHLSECFSHINVVYLDPIQSDSLRGGIERSCCALSRSGSSGRMQIRDPTLFPSVCANIRPLSTRNDVYVFHPLLSFVLSGFSLFIRLA
ncbi:unnamed protein product [Aspergillus oryzae RIB40]|uniref:DNA, SC138 n=1 Tax=Aspergillus oryzae (strain ATCC 42149 / RIB 40) TaxID=510516 RepID=Q2U1Q3_ASPOR|nr:unnamed protein product [Aspergillus oryzae RIB40]BAE64512.1 unnamed protein product [Aspergillus oryzae RIB40]